MSLILRAACAAVLTVCAATAVARAPTPPPPASQAERDFAAEVERDGGPAADAVLQTLAKAKLQQSILDAIARPAEATKTWAQYRPIFITQKRIDDGIAFYRDNRELIDRIATQYGVPAEIIVAIMGVETGYGKITGACSMP